MEIEKALNGTELTLKIMGRLDTVTAPELEACLKESFDGVALLFSQFYEILLCLSGIITFGLNTAASSGVMVA